MSLSEIENLKSKGVLFNNEPQLEKDDLNLLSFNLELSIKKINSIENLNENEDALETKSFYLANIVKIEFLKNEKNINLKHLEQYCSESISIASNLKKNCKTKPWFKEIVNLRKEIENKFKNLNPAPPIEDVDDINEKFMTLFNKGDEELLRYILKNYPYQGYKFSEESINEYKKNKRKFLLSLRKKYIVVNYSTVIDMNNAKVNDKILEYINKIMESIGEDD